eukprot:TRINITY_DN3955_c0_g1_i2.p1 TRINITY_DN3955_c0_g1~~TRINITY_DN3955_c0_g1_i2.p1  ORF type:complete len:373 (-),score=83.08 TRINITY_DN3955_c0_g1_i2:948-2066(-)
MFRFPDIDERFREMHRRHDELFRSMFAGDPFSQSFMQSPFMSLDSSRGLGAPRSSSTSRILTAPQSPARLSRSSSASPSRQRNTVSVAEVDSSFLDEENGAEVSETERQAIEEAIRLSLVEEQKKRAPVIEDLDDDDIEEIYAKHAQRRSPSRSPTTLGTRSNPISFSSDNLNASVDDMMIDNDYNVPITTVDDEEEALKAAIEASLETSKQDEFRRQEKERNDLIRQQQEEYEASVREDLEIERKNQWRNGWIARAARKENLPFEPVETSPDAVKLMIRLPNGSRLNRRFSRTDTIATVKRFIDYEIANTLLSQSTPKSGDQLEGFVPSSPIEVTYDLATDYPNQLFENTSISLEQAQLVPRAVISARLRK